MNSKSQVLTLTDQLFKICLASQSLLGIQATDFIFFPSRLEKVRNTGSFVSQAFIIIYHDISLDISLYILYI